MSVLKGLQRKYGATEADVLSFLHEASSRLTTLATADERLAELAADAEQLQADLRGPSRRRHAAAGPTPRRRSAAALERELQQLGMPGATIAVELDPVARARALGGRARRAPALAVAGAEVVAAREDGIGRRALANDARLSERDGRPRRRADARVRRGGCGHRGEAGLAVGRRLARLAEGRQVLVVTHLPQIACFADRHILVEKDAGTATVRALSDDERVHELSRMLAGLTGSEGAVTHAEELLATASASRGASRPLSPGRAARAPHDHRGRRLRSFLTPASPGGNVSLEGRIGRDGHHRKESHTSTSKTRGSRRWSNRRGREAGVARVDRRTKDLVPRARRGDIAVIDHEDLDRVAAEGLVAAGVAAVVNASASISGRYPNLGPLILIEAGIPLLDQRRAAPDGQGAGGRRRAAVGRPALRGRAPRRRSASSRATPPSLRDMERAQDALGATVRELRAQHARVPGGGTRPAVRRIRACRSSRTTSPAGPSSSWSAATATGRTWPPSAPTSATSGRCSWAWTAAPTPSSTTATSPT